MILINKTFKEPNGEKFLIFTLDEKSKVVLSFYLKSLLSFLAFAILVYYLLFVIMQKQHF